MKLIFAILFSLSSLAISAQMDFQELSGNWIVKSFSLNGKVQKVEKLSFIVGDTDVGDHFLEYSYYDTNEGECIWTVLIVEKGGNKYLHEVLLENPDCPCSLTGEYIYKFDNGVLTISNSKNKLELVRKN